jgi:hypothetical protein
VKALRRITGVLLAAVGVAFILGAVALLVDRDQDVPPWMIGVMLIILGLLPLGGAFFLLRPTLIAPSRVCPQCGGKQQQAAGVLRRSHSLWLLYLGGWLFASLWGASRQQQVRCCQCETLYLTETRVTRIAGVLLWVFLLLILLGVLAEALKTR